MSPAIFVMHCAASDQGRCADAASELLLLLLRGKLLLLVVLLLVTLLLIIRLVVLRLGLTLLQQRRDAAHRHATVDALRPLASGS